MTVILPLGRACSRQLIARARPSSTCGVSRAAWSSRDTTNIHLLAQKSLKPSYLNIISRLYASNSAPPSRPKAHTGRAKAAKPKTTRAAASTRAKPTKKAPAKKKTAAKAKPRPKSKAKPRRKSKAKSKRKVLTAEQKEINAKRAAKRKETIAKKSAISKRKQLKQDALVNEEAASGGSRAISVFNALVQEQGKGARGTSAPDIVKQAAAKLRNLSPQEREEWNHRVNELSAQKERNYRKWLQSLKPDQIRQANLARASLRREAAKKNPGKRIIKPRALRDERLVKKPTTGFFYFINERKASGDFKGLKLAEMSKLLSSEWKNLGQNGQKPYIDRAAADSRRYKTEHKTVYGFDAPGSKSKKTATA